VVKFDSSQCSYLFGIRAAAIMAPPRARNRQSHRVTPPSGFPGTGFHPEPAHRGQTSAAVFMIVYFILYVVPYLDSAPEATCAATRKRFLSVHILWRAAAGCGEGCRTEENFQSQAPTNRTYPRKALSTFDSFSNHYTAPLA
jgi:hypothetical protein